MVFSQQPPYLFVHIDKAAGSSIAIALEPVKFRQKPSRWRRRVVWLGRLNRLGSYRSLQFPAHAYASAAKRCLPPEVYAGLFKFAFVRNPWDRLVSRYAYLLKNEKHPRHGFVQKMKGFDDYVAWEVQRGKFFQYTYVTDSSGKLIVDFIGHYERLSEDFAKVCERLGRKVELPRANASSHRDYRTYYSDATRELVGSYFQRDIEMFGYDFDGLKK
jgi:sulfotransferase famil protein